MMKSSRESGFLTFWRRCRKSKCPENENSIKHGYSYTHTDLEVLISVQAEGDHLLIKVENNGEPISLSEAELQKIGVGLANIKDRLNNLYGSNFFFEMRNKADNDGVETIVRIPLK